MKRIALGMSVVLTLGLCWGTLAHQSTGQKSSARIFASNFLATSEVDSHTYNSTLTGSETGPAMPDRLMLSGQAAADSNGLNGFYQITLNYNRATKEVTGGNWFLTISQQNEDGTTAEAGTLNGTVSGGTVALNDDGKVTGISGVQLVIVGGNRSYSAIKSGSGTFEGQLRADDGVAQMPPVPENGQAPPPPPAQQGAPPANEQPKQPFSGKLSLSF